MHNGNVEGSGCQESYLFTRNMYIFHYLEGFFCCCKKVPGHKQSPKQTYTENYTLEDCGRLIVIWMAYTQVHAMPVSSGLYNLRPWAVTSRWLTWPCNPTNPHHPTTTTTTTITTTTTNNNNPTHPTPCSIPVSLISLIWWVLIRRLTNPSPPWTPYDSTS